MAKILCNTHEKLGEDPSLLLSIRVTVEQGETTVDLAFEVELRHGVECVACERRSRQIGQLIRKYWIGPA